MKTKGTISVLVALTIALFLGWRPFERRKQVDPVRVGSSLAEAPRATRALALVEPAPGAREALASPVEALPWTVRVERSGEPAAGAEVLWMELTAEQGDSPQRGSTDVLEELRRLGGRVKTGRGGEAALRPFAGMLGASDGEQTTYREVTLEAASPIVLTLERELDLEVRVVDERGTPLPGVPVVANLHGPRQWQSRATTGAAGSALFLHLGMNRGIDPGATLVRVSVDAVAMEGEPFTFPYDQPPPNPVVLVLGAHGSLVIELCDPAGEHLDGNGSIWLEPLLEDVGGVRQVVRVHDHGRLRAGRVRFPVVALGRTFVCRLDDERLLADEARATGPVEAGEEVVLRLVARPPPRILVLAPQGQALRSAAVHVEGQGHAEDRMTDEEGALALVLDGRGRAETFEMRHERPTDDGPEVWWTTFTFDPRTDELRASRSGDVLDAVRLERLPALAQGRVVDSTGADVPAEVEVRNASGWHVPGIQAFTATGFVLFGRSQEPELRLHVSGDFAPRDPVVFVPGQRGLEIVVGAEVPPSRVAIGFAPMEGLPLEGIGIRLTGGGFRQETFLQEDSPRDLTLECPVPDAPVEVTFMLSPSGQDLFSVPDVAVQPGTTTRDPRLAHVDLRRHVRNVTVHVRRADRTLAEGWVAGTTGASNRGVQLLEEGVARLLAAREPIELEVHCSGARTQRVTVPAQLDEVDVVLEPGIPLTVELAPGLELPPEGVLRLEFSRDQNLPAWRGARPAGALVTGETVTATESAGRFALVLPATGGWRARLEVVHADGGREPLELQAGGWFSVPRGVDLVRIEPDLEAWGRLVPQH